MMRLTKVELRRLYSRRLTFIALFGALAIIGLILFSTFQQAKPLSGPQLAAQRVHFDQTRADWVANGAQHMQECLKSQTEAQKTNAKADFRCDQLEPKWANWGKPKPQFADLMETVLLGGSYLLAFIGFLIGAGFVAAEFSSGSMANWLTFEPRRMRVYFSKLVAVGLGLTPVVVALIALLTGGVWLIVGHFGSTAGVSAKVWGDSAEMAARSVVLVIVGAVAGAAMGALLRHTAAVIGIAMAYLVLVEGIFGRALQSAQPWLLRLNFDGWLQHGTKYFINTCTTDSQGNYNCAGVEKLVAFGHSASYLGLLVALLIGVSAFAFGRRDVN